jgi:bifunctional non-homologous end joining protein LigD
VKTFARALAHELAALHGAWLTDKMPRSERVRRVFIDTSQNDPGKQTVAPYSLRATMIPLVSAPLAWSDLHAPLPVTPERLLERVDREADLFAGVLTLRQTL